MCTAVGSCVGLAQADCLYISSLLTQQSSLHSMTFPLALSSSALQAA